jgi:hypothetical protein
MFSETPTMYTRTRALYRLLNTQKHRLISDEQWLSIQKLRSHVDEHCSGDDSDAIANASGSATARTGTELSIHEVVNLYCTVSTTRTI